MDAWMVVECLLSHSDQMTAIQCWFNTAVQQLMADLAAVEGDFCAASLPELMTGTVVHRLRFFAMPRFFFNQRCPDVAFIDGEGVYFATPEEAREAAVATARSVLAAETENGPEWLRSTFEVADERGEVVCEVHFRETTCLDESQTRQ